MSSVVAALDNYTPKQLGEKGHTEWGWSNNIQERVLQLFFQLTRCDKDRKGELEKTYRTLLDDCKDNPEYMDILYRLALQTRDLIDGKGEYGLGMHLLHALDRQGHNELVQNTLYYYVTCLYIIQMLKYLILMSVFHYIHDYRFFGKFQLGQLLLIM